MSPEIEKERKRIPWEATGWARIPCEVGSGFGPGEYGIIIRLPSGGKINTLAPSDLVELCGEKPSPGIRVKGELLVRVHRVEQDRVQIILPDDSISHGYSPRVPKELLRGEFEDLFWKRLKPKI